MDVLPATPMPLHQYTRTQKHATSSHIPHVPALYLQNTPMPYLTCRAAQGFTNSFIRTPPGEVMSFAAFVWSCVCSRVGVRSASQPVATLCMLSVLGWSGAPREVVRRHIKSRHDAHPTNPESDDALCCDCIICSRHPTTPACLGLHLSRTRACHTVQSLWPRWCGEGAVWCGEPTLKGPSGCL